MADNPQHKWSDLSPESVANPKKKMGEHFDEAGSPPNSPNRKDVPQSWNVTYDYENDHDSDD
jgi:uncharacterized protein YbdZ (MbtH family)